MTPPVAEHPLFFLDYDGTLAPIVDDPSAAHPHPEAPALLEALMARYPMWIITGRHLRDLTAFLDLALPAVGLHGAQEGILSEEPASLMSDEARQAAARMRASVPEVEGLVVEDKEHAFAVHYRQATDKEAARTALEKWMAAAPDALEAIWGKKVVELRARGLTKGTAVRRIADEHPERAPVYLGDDVTDEDAFAALAEIEGAVTVKVGPGETAARYRLDGPEQVVAYLKKYVSGSTRPESSAPKAATRQSSEDE